MKTIASPSDVADLTSKQPDTSQEYEQPRYSRRDTVLTMTGVLMVMLLASLDQIIVSTAMPRMIGDLQGFDRSTWVSSAYLLSSRAANRNEVSQVCEHVFWYLQTPCSLSGIGL